MKPVRRIFLILGAMSMFSLFQFNAMGDDCVTNVGVGRYCKQQNDKRDCPKGCWCEGKIKKSTGDLDVDAICKGKQPTQSQLQVLHDAKVFICGIDNSGSPVLAHSNKKAKSSSDCILDNMGCISHEEGSYCSEGTNVRSCPKGCYCSGKDNDGKDQRYNQLPVHLSTQDVDDACQNKTVAYGSNFGVKNYLERRGVFYCPDGYNAATGAGSITECKNASGHFYSVPVVDMGGLRPSVTPRVCSDGYYLEETGSGKYIAVECKICPKGYYCPDKKNKHACTGNTYTSQEGQQVCQVCEGKRRVVNENKTGCKLCPGLTVANANHTSCINNPELSAPVPDANLNREFDIAALTDLVLQEGEVYKYKVTYQCGVGGTGNPNDPNMYESDNTVTLLDASSCAAKTGYVFKEWGCSRGSVKVSINNGTFTMPSGGVVCAAQWKCVSGYGWRSNECVICNGENQYIDVSGNCQTCSDGLNDTGDGCVNSSGQDVPPINSTSTTCNIIGKYLDDDNDCVSCESGHFCPGNGEQHRCPAGTSIGNGASCKFDLNKDKLYNGLGSSSKNCWKHLNQPAQYRTCVYGIDINHF